MARYATRSTWALGECVWMPCRTVATLGAVAVIRLLIWSLPPCTNWSWQGVPFGFGVKQCTRMSKNPTSLPPICTVTNCVLASRLSNCGGLGPGVTFWGDVMFAVVAPEQLASRNVGTCNANATRCG